MSDLFTIGFTKSSAEDFFGRLRRAGVKKVIDTRLKNSSQLAGFAKAGDLPFFLRAIGDIAYEYRPELAPTEAIIALAGKKDWQRWESAFLDLMAERRIEKSLRPADLAGACLLCAEAKPHHCHRRLVAEYLQAKWKSPFTITHL